MVGVAPNRFRLTGPMIAITAIIVMLLLIMPLPWVSWGREVDINSGRVRETTWVVGMPVKQHVEDTWVSQAAEPQGEPDWHFAVTQDWWNHVSPHYRYHAAWNQIKAIKLMHDSLPWDNQAQTAAAEQLLRHWQTGSDEAADDYITQLEAMLSQELAGPKDQRRVTFEDLSEVQLSNGE